MNKVKDIVFTEQLLNELKKQYPEAYEKNFSELIRTLVSEGVKYNNNLNLEEGTYAAIKDTVKMEVKAIYEDEMKLLYKTSYISALNIQLILFLLKDEHLEILQEDFPQFRTTALTLLKAKEYDSPLLTKYFDLFQQ